MQRFLAESTALSAATVVRRDGRDAGSDAAGAVSGGGLGGDRWVEADREVGHSPLPMGRAESPRELRHEAGGAGEQPGAVQAHLLEPQRTPGLRALAAVCAGDGPLLAG